MRRSFLGLLALVAALAVAPFPAGPVSASCVGPTLEGVEGRVLERGASVTVEGRFFVDGCQDVMVCTGSFGCESCGPVEPPPEPLLDVALTLVQGGRSWELGVADATADGGRPGDVSWTFEVPDGVRPGRARLRPEHGEPVRVRVR